MANEFVTRNGIKIGDYTMPTSIGSSDQSFVVNSGGTGLTFRSLTNSDVGLGNVENTALSTWSGSSNITTVGTITGGTWQGTALTDSYISSAATWNAKQDALTFGIADGNAVDIDAGASIVANDYVKFSATGLIGQTYSEVKTDLSLNNVENTALSTWSGSSNITTVGTITGGTWQGTAITDAYISSASTWNSKASINGTPSDNQVSVFTDSNTIEGDSKFLYNSSTGIVSIKGATSGGLFVDVSGDTSGNPPTGQYQSARFQTLRNNVQYDPTNSGAQSPTLIVSVADPSTEPSQGTIGAGIAFTSTNYFASGGPQANINVVKGSTVINGFDGALLVFSTREPGDGPSTSVSEALRLGQNQYVGAHYRPDAFSNPPAMLTVGTDLTGDNTIGIRETSSTPGGISNYGQYYVKSSDNLPYFKDSSGTEYRLVTEGNARVDNFYYSISNSVDTRPIFEDTNVLFNWDETGNDLEFRMKLTPSGSGDMRSLAYIVGGSTQNTFITTPLINFDVYSPGVSAGERLEVFITAENDVTYPAYHVTVYNTGESVQNTVWIQRITRN